MRAIRTMSGDQLNAKTASKTGLQVRATSRTWRDHLAAQIASKLNYKRATPSARLALHDGGQSNAPQWLDCVF